MPSQDVEACFRVCFAGNKEWGVGGGVRISVLRILLGFACDLACVILCVCVCVCVCVCKSEVKKGHLFFFLLTAQALPHSSNV